MKTNPTRVWSVYAALCLAVGVLLVALAPAALLGQFTHPDERHYTDAALWMLETGDYLTPRYHDGSPRLRKPVGVYWCVAAAFHRLGVSPAAAHAAPIAAGALLILVTYLLGREATGDSETGVLAAYLLLAHPLFLLQANIVNPDIFLALALGIGFLGLTRGIQRGGADAAAWGMLFGGAFLAVITKGLLGLVFLGFAVWTLRKSANRTVSPWAIGIGIGALFVLGLGGLWLRHRGEFLREFLYDQIFGRLMSGSWFAKPGQMLAYLLFLPLSLHLWWIPLSKSLRRGGIRALSPEIQRAYGGWACLCAFIFGMGNHVTPRYILSTIPLLAVAAALVLRATPPVANRGPKGLLPGALFLVALLSLPLTRLPFPDPAGAWYSLGALALVALLLWWKAPRELSLWLCSAVGVAALSPLAALYLQNTWLRPAWRPLAELYAHIREQYPAVREVLVDRSPGDLSRARMKFGHTFLTTTLQDYVWLKRSDPVDARLRPADIRLEAGGGEDEFVNVLTLEIPESSLRRLRRDGIPIESSLNFGLRLLREGYPLRAYVLQVRPEHLHSRNRDPADFSGSIPENGP